MSSEMEENLDAVEDVVEDMFPALVATVAFSAAILVVFFLRLYIRWSVACPSDNRLDGKTVIVTGANSGLGKATATELAKRGARIILACRDQAKGEAVVRNIKKKTSNQNVFFAQLDLASQRSIRMFVEDFNRKEVHLHVLINNAAYMGPKAATEDGFERCLGVNYLGHFYLTYLLVDKLRKCAPSRIINVVSDSYLKGQIEFDDLALARGYNIYRAYARSKLAQVVFTVEAHRHFFTDVILSYAVHPGAVYTDLLRNWPGLYGNFLRVAARILFKSPENGCQSVVYAAVADKIKENSGRLIQNCKVTKYKDFVRDKDLGKKLWEASLSLCGYEVKMAEADENETQ